MSTHAITVQTPLSDQLAQADFFVKSGFMPKHFDTVPKVYAAITLGQELGLAPWAALNNIFVIGGKPSINANLMLSLIQSSGLLTEFDVDVNEARAIVKMSRRGVGSYTSTFGMDDAKRAGLLSGNNSRMWNTYPKAMLKARAIADCARTLFADVLLGMYTPDELGAQVSGVAVDGSLIIVPPLPLTKDEARTLAKKWLDSDGLTSADIRAALECGWEEWTKGYESADEAVRQWLVKQRGNAESPQLPPGEHTDPESEDDDQIERDFIAALDRDPDPESI